MSIFAKRLKYEREEKKKQNPIWTQGYVAELLGVARTTYTAYENGTKQPPLETVNKLADFFEVNTDYLLGRTDNPKGSAITKEYDPLDEINKLIKQFGIEDFGFFNIEEWKNFTPEDVEELKRHFEWVAHKARERNEEKK